MVLIGFLNINPPPWIALLIEISKDNQNLQRFNVLWLFLLYQLNSDSFF